MEVWNLWVENANEPPGNRGLVGVSIKSLRVSARGRPPEGEGFSLSHALSQTHNNEYGVLRWHRHELKLAIACKSCLVEPRRALFEEGHDAFLVARRGHLGVLRGFFPLQLFV